MRYISTRGGIDPISFTEAVMMGLAADGGLLLPDPLPSVDSATLDVWKDLSYPDLALKIMDLFIDDLSNKKLGVLINDAYITFNTPDVTPIVKVGKHYILELFHGPTLAFKDVALQVLGNLFSLFLKESGEKMNILGATSGDTGSAAIYGVRGKDNINIFILHPQGRVSKVQALQMTTVPEKNVFNIALKGTFDDCQAIVKAIFNQLDFKSQYHLGSINSINWARVLAQVVYYVYATLKVKEQTGDEPVNFSVPTGNFGDIFAGYIAKQLIRPNIGRLVLATNENNILTRFVLQGHYAKSKVIHTISPSMDIQVASNFERYLYYLYNQEPERVKQAFMFLDKKDEIIISREERAQVRRDFASASIDQASTITTIRDIYKKTGYILDPHTAVGVAAAERLVADLPKGPTICLATAHPAKFPDAVSKAIGREPERPESLKGIEDRSSRYEVLPAEVDAVKNYIVKHAL
ncbi:MAG: threonine synthase [Deltaproteobacteria bacterium]|nr:threonine synthase [Deltaproteobacteria bacterium]MBW1933014.1 threonine synthase [Deltaproteobacteria bacterium]MBW1938312.1 threonine synthase [Deltaproteobacteria bacterium]MBW1964752.1 threonine synthase [Deltaproteobacteria bacterium]MBW2080603.1 threonine synthase [Deltaproteobacteria bacterium]